LVDGSRSRLGAARIYRFVLVEPDQAPMENEGEGEDPSSHPTTSLPQPAAEGGMRPLIAGPPWTLEEDELLRSLALSGASVAAMAKRLQRSQAAVRNRANRLNIVVAKSRRVKAKRR